MASELSKRERSYLSSLFGSWALLMERINETRDQRLRDLPKSPSPEQLQTEKQWIAELVNTCDTIMWALSEEGVTDALGSIVEAIQDEKAVPDDVRQPAIDLWNAWVFMFTGLRPKAVSRATRLDEIIEIDEKVEEVVAEWKERLGSPVESP